jgi:hypothetical protein
VKDLDDLWVFLAADQCLHPDTLIQTLNGAVKISSLSVGTPVLTYRDGRIKWGAVTRIKTVRPKKAYKVTFDNDESVIASYDHRWPTLEKVQARKTSGVVVKTTEELRIGERMVPCRPGSNGGGYKTWYSRSHFIYDYEHHLVAEAYLGPCPEGHEVHHKDDDPTNNSPGNLEYKLRYDHRAEHMRVIYAKQDHAVRIKALREGVKKRRSYNGRGNPNSKLSDEDMQFLHQFVCVDNWTASKVADHFGLSYGYSNRLVKKIKRGLNHKIIAIEPAGTQPMFTITVEPDHNYVLACGVVTQNSQIEVRMLAEISGDRLLISQFNTGQDIHCLVGNSLTGWPVERIKAEKNLRKMVKNMHFGVIFGLGRESLYPYVVAKIRAIDGKNADMTGITYKRLVKLYDKYFKTYTGVAAFIQKMHDQAENEGFVETLYGFRRDINKTNEHGRKTFWANQAVNSPIQGSAHGLILIALALLEMKSRTYGLLQKCLMEIHDALVFRVHLRDLPEAYKQCKHLMQEGAAAYSEREFGIKLHVPLIAEASAGFCMGSLTDYEGGPVEEFLSRWREKQREVEFKRWEDLMPEAIAE